MKVTILKTGEAIDVNESYGLRLMEQGKAVICKTATARNARKGKQDGASGQNP